MKSAVELNRLLLNFVLLCHVDIQERSRERNLTFYRNNSGEQNILENSFLRLSKSLKSEILAIMVLPLGYTGFTTNLPFSATRRLERMLYILTLHCCKLSLYAISRKTNELKLRKWQKSFISGQF